ncbi:uncharacterized protein V2V93DRAFT_364467 [Kockiozyma suomiensis]|uniref:uncharacterized protein n=1 Tax=Kockiozyma suomiensis TaxID=1337062 RepID=UPI0033432460
MDERGPPRVKNKAAAPLQISAEQILHEAYESRESALQVPKQRIADLEELHEFQGRKRKEYEDALRWNRQNINQWIRYARFELEQKEYARARSIFERTLEIAPTDVPLWLRYIESEIKERNINHARNLFDRAVTLLPRIDKLWYKYVSMEEALTNVTGTRQVFERWMEWEPEPQAWLSYINMEKRYGEIERARSIFERFTIVHPQSENWIKWARFEDEYGTPENVREVYATAVDSLRAAGDEFVDETLLGSWAKYETRQKNFQKAREIYRLGLDTLSRANSMRLYNAYSAFEKQYGEREGIEDVVFKKRKVKYEEQVHESPRDYDIWFAYLNMAEESSKDTEEIRDLYERSIANVPPTAEKRHWRRYIFLWIKYAIFEELVTKDFDQTREVYKACLNLIPHKKFTFAKIWYMYACFEIRRNNLAVARKQLGMALGMCPKPKLFKNYIELEMKLREFDRCRKIYEKFLQTFPKYSQAWLDYAELEQMLGDEDRARAILELAMSIPGINLDQENNEEEEQEEVEE